MAVARQERVNVPDNFNKKEIALRCQCVALSLQHIIDMRDVSPWPHPKNIRYLERYKLKRRRADGSIEAVPLDDSSQVIKKNKMNESSTRNCESLLRDVEAVNGKDMEKKEIILGEAKKKRKQLRKR